METVKKTYKRETAWAILLFIAGLLIWGVTNENAMKAAELLIFPGFGFTGIAFGMDAYSKQIMGGEG